MSVVVQRLKNEATELALLADGEALLEYMANHMDLRTGKVSTDHAKKVILAWLAAHKAGQVYV
jgi:hypothetical protein